MVRNLLALDDHVQTVHHLLLGGPHWGGGLVDLTPGQRVVCVNVERSDGVQVEVELTVITSVQNRTAL